VSIDTKRRDGPTHGERMIDLVNRLRRIARMAGETRVQSLEVEQRDPREVAAALMRLCAALGFEISRIELHH
jgi:hypothetical protein